MRRALGPGQAGCMMHLATNADVPISILKHAIHGAIAKQFDDFDRAEVLLYQFIPHSKLCNFVDDLFTDESGSGSADDDSGTGSDDSDSGGDVQAPASKKGSRNDSGSGNASRIGSSMFYNLDAGILVLLQDGKTFEEYGFGPGDQIKIVPLRKDQQEVQRGGEGLQYLWDSGGVFESAPSPSVASAEQSPTDVVSGGGAGKSEDEEIDDDAVKPQGKKPESKKDSKRKLAAHRQGSKLRVQSSSQPSRQRKVAVKRTKQFPVAAVTAAAVDPITTAFEILEKQYHGKSTLKQKHIKGIISFLYRKGLLRNVQGYRRGSHNVLHRGNQCMHIVHQHKKSHRPSGRAFLSELEEFLRGSAQVVNVNRHEFENMEAFRVMVRGFVGQTD